MTGASSGIGRAIAETFAAQGATVLLTHRASPERAREVADAIAGRGGRALVAQADLGTREACERLVAQARDELGRLDVWVNNAGVDVLTGDAAAWDWERKLDALLAVDLKGTIACSYAAGEVMRRQDGGGDDPQHELGPRDDRDGRRRPAAVLRRQGRRAGLQQEPRARPGARRCASTCCARVGSRPSFGEQADREFHRSVAEATPLGRWGRPQDVADAALYLASPEAAFVTGQAINVNGGVL